MLVSSLTWTCRCVSCWLMARRLNPSALPGFSSFAEFTWTVHFQYSQWTPGLTWTAIKRDSRSISTDRVTRLKCYLPHAEGNVCGLQWSLLSRSKIRFGQVICCQLISQKTCFYTFLVLDWKIILWKCSMSQCLTQEGGYQKLSWHCWGKMFWQM